MVFEITTAANGWILRQRDDDTSLPVVGVEEYEYRDTHECFADFLREVLNNYGPGHSKYFPKNIHISVIPGKNTGGLSESIEYLLERFLREYEEADNWESYGRRIYEEMSSMLKESIEFKKKHGYDTSFIESLLLDVHR